MRSRIALDSWLCRKNARRTLPTFPDACGPLRLTWTRRLLPTPLRQSSPKPDVKNAPDLTAVTIHLESIPGVDISSRRPRCPTPTASRDDPRLAPR